MHALILAMISREKSKGGRIGRYYAVLGAIIRYHSAMRILVIRNDRLGDFMLAWPALALLRHHMPKAQIDVQVPSYTAPIAEICPSVDSVLLIPSPEPGLSGALALASRLRANKYDAMISLYTTGTVATAGMLAQIPYRLAPATKWVQLLANQRLTQRRSRSLKPEFAYNCDLIDRFLNDHNISTPARPHNDPTAEYLPEELTRPLLTFDPGPIESLRKRFFQQHQIEPGARLIFIHPGSGGSATTLQRAQYAKLVSGLNSQHNLHYIITAGPGEQQYGSGLVEQLQQQGEQATLLQPQGGLVGLAQHLALSDLLISGSTGPLHIAGALNRPTATFYPGHRSATPLRWQALNAADRRLAFIPPEGGDPKDVSRSQIEPATTAVEALLQRTRTC